MFKNCVSLGWYCGTACSLSKLGLRSFSGPFDWYFANEFSSVVYMVESRFVDFLNRDNIVPVKTELQQFEDIKYGMYFLHDNDERLPFEKAFPNIKAKYQRRINAFLERIVNPSCFFRSVASDTEIDYINDNYGYINQVFKKYNPENEVYYILHSDYKELSPHCNQFRLPTPYSQRPDKEEGMRVMFDQSLELVTFCNQLIDDEQRQRNLEYDFKTKAHWWTS